MSLTKIIHIQTRASILLKINNLIVSNAQDLIIQCIYILITNLSTVMFIRIIEI